MSMALSPLSAHSAYRKQSQSAASRGIEWLITFEEWWGIWDASGKWDQRGRRGDQYCMARFNDEGPYAVGNVEIITNRKNCADSRHNNPESTKANARLASASRLGRGQGWTLIKRLKSKPYQVMVGSTFVGMFASQQEAEAAYRSAVDRHLESSLGSAQ
jgi:hypothetical protein